MKFIFSICVIFATVGVLSFAKDSSRILHPTTVSSKPCPEKLTTAQCEAHIKAEIAKEKSCISATVRNTIIQLNSCKPCSQVPGAWKIIEADIKKPFPECCPSCELKPLKSSNYYLSMKTLN